MATQFQNRLIGTVILVSLGVIFLPDLLTGKHNNPHEPVASVPMNPGEVAVKPAVSSAVVPATVSSASAAVIAAAPSGAQGAAPEGVVIASGNTEQWSVEDVADTTTVNNAAAASVAAPANPATTAAKPVTKPIAEKKPEVKVVAKSNVADSKPVAEVRTAEPVAEKPRLQAGQIKPFAEVADNASATAATKATLPVSKPVSKPMVPATSASGGAWTIQAGVFSSSDNARALIGRLRASGLPASLTPVRSGSTTLYRVTVGPDASRARLEAMVPKVSQIAGTSAKIVAYSPLG